MFETKLAEDIGRKLSSINPNLKVEPLLLTKAYLSHRVKAKLKSFFDQDLYVLKDYLINEFFNEDSKLSNITDNIRNIFRSCRTLGQFLNMFAPDLVVDIDAVKAMFPEQETDQISLLLNILVVKKIAQEQDLSVKSIQNGLWELYTKEVENFPKTISLIQSRDELSKLIRAMFSVDINSGLNSDVFSNEGETVRLRLYNIAGLLFDTLQWSRSQILGFCAKHYEYKNNRKLVEDSVDEEVDYLIDKISVSDFLPRDTALQSTRDSIERLCNELNNRAINSNPIDLHCAIYLYKKQVYDIGHQKSEAKRRLSIDIEDTVAFNLFTGELFDLDNHNVLLILPSPFFMRKYGETDFTRNLHTTVVVPDVNYLAMFAGQYANNPDTRKKNHNFEFITVRHYLESEVKKNDYDRIIYFENHTDSLKEIDFNLINRRLALSRPDNHIYVFSDRKSGIADNALFNIVLPSQDWIIEDILQLPGNDPSVSGNKIETMLWRASIRTDNSNAFTNVCKGKKNWKRRRKKSSIAEESELMTGRRIVINYDAYKEVNLTTHCTNNRESVWNLGKPERQENKDDRNRIAHHFSSEIDMFCAYRNLKTDGSFLADGYTCFPDAIAGKRGTKIPGSEKRVPVMYSNPDMIELWLSSIYPFETFREYEGQKRESVRAVISEAYKPVLMERPITFKTFWYVYEGPLDEIENANSFGKIQCVFRLFAYSDYGNMLLDRITLDEYKDFLSQIDLTAFGTTEEKMLMAFSEALDIAIKKGHCSKNILSVDDEDNLSKKSLIAIKEILKKKTMTESEFRYSYSSMKTKERLSEEDYAILIRLFTGLETNIVSALRWEDFIPIPEYGFHVLNIYKEIENSGEEKKLKSIDAFRVIPCSELLSKFLIDKKERQRAKASDYIIKGDGPGGFFKPVKLADKCKEFVSEMHFDPVIVSIDSGNGYREENLSEFKGNIFKQNIRYWLIKSAGFLTDEMRYFLGLKPTTTIFSNYIDMRDENSLYALYVKLRRLDAFLEFGSDKTEYQVKTDHISFNEEAYLPSDILIEFESEKDLTIEIKQVRHGLVSKQL